MTSVLKIYVYKCFYLFWSRNIKFSLRFRFFDIDQYFGKKYNSLRNLLSFAFETIFPGIRKTQKKV
jgi:hypothetical protein